jgi:hypothetical protein
VNSAWIAVIGTLGGVALTATAGLLTAMLSGRQQQEALSRQFRQEDNRKIREERRAIFVEYLTAYDAALGRAYQVVNNLHASARSTSTPEGRPFETVAEKEMARLN